MKPWEYIVAAIVFQIVITIVAAMRMKVISRRYTLLHHIKQHPEGISENKLRRELSYPPKLRDDLEWLERKRVVLRKAFYASGNRKPLEIFILIT